MDDHSAGRILDALAVEPEPRRQLTLSHLGYSLLHTAGLLAGFPAAEEVLSHSVIPRDETTRARELDPRLGEYSLPDGSRVFSEARWHALERQGLVLALAAGEVLVPLIPPELSDSLGSKSPLIPAIPMHAEDKREYERQLTAAFECAQASTDLAGALAEAAEQALLTLYSSFGSPYGANLARVLRSVLLESQTHDRQP